MDNLKKGSTLLSILCLISIMSLLSMMLIGNYKSLITKEKFVINELNEKRIENNN